MVNEAFRSEVEDLQKNSIRLTEITETLYELNHIK